MKKVISMLPRVSRDVVRAMSKKEHDVLTECSEIRLSMHDPLKHDLARVSDFSPLNKKKIRELTPDESKFAEKIEFSQSYKRVGQDTGDDCATRKRSSP